jgi:hypothetical protein
MADRTLSLGVQVDDASIQRGKKRLEELQRAQERLAQAQSKYAGDSSKAGRAIQEGIEKRSKELTNEQIRLERALKNTSKAFIEQQSAASRAAKGVGAAQDASSERRGGVKLGGQSAERLRTIGREIRGLPSVQVPGLGIGTDTFGRAAEVAGRLGVSLGQLAAGGAVTVLAVGAIALAFKKFNDAAKKQAEELNAVVDARRTVGQDVAKGLTSDDANTRLEEINRLREAEAVLLADLQQRYNDNITSQNALAETVLKLTPQEQALADQIKKSEAAVAGFNTEQTALEKALQDGAIAANDAAEAERKLADERIHGVLSEAAQAGELEATRQRLVSATQEQIVAEKRGIEAKLASAQAELASLQASGDTSEAVQQRIEQITDTIAKLGEQTQVLDQLRGSAKTDEQVAREKALESARNASARATDAAFQSELAKAQAGTEALKADRKAEQDRAKDAQKALGDRRKAASKTRKDEQNEAEKAAEKRRDIEQKLQDDLNELAIKFNQDQQKEQRKAEFDLMKIDRDGKRAEQDAIRERNFAAAADAAEATQDQKSDLQDQLRFEQREREIAYREQQGDLRRSRDNQLRDLQASYQQQEKLQVNFLQRSINVWVQYFDSLAKMQSRATGGAAGKRGLSVNDMQYVQGA